MPNSNAPFILAVFKGLLQTVGFSLALTLGSRFLMSSYFLEEDSAILVLLADETKSLLNRFLFLSLFYYLEKSPREF